MDPFWEAIRMRVCRTCVDGDGSGHCHLPRSEECALRTMHGDVLRLVATEDLRWKKDPAGELRRRICPRCSHWHVGGNCSGHEQGECTFERFLPELVAIARSMSNVRIDQAHASPW